LTKIIKIKMSKNINTFTILTYNTWGLKVGPFSLAKDIHKRFKLLPEALNKLNPDIILLQEVWRKKERNYLIDSLKAQGYSYCYFKSATHPILEYLKLNRLKSSFVGNGLLTLSKYPIHKNSSDALAFNHFTALKEWFSRKGALYTPVTIDSVGTIDIYNAHLGSINYIKKKEIFSSAHQKKQTFQLKELITFIKRKSNQQSLIIGADLNISDVHKKNNSTWFPDANKDFQNFIRELNLVDSFRQSNPDIKGSTFNSNTHYKNPDEGPEQRIDYILHRSTDNKFSLKSSRIVLNQPIGRVKRNINLSDHFGVLSEYFLNNV